MLVVTPGIANLIRENKTFRITSAIQTGAKFGMQLLDDHLFNLWHEEKVDQGRRARQVPTTPTTWPSGIAQRRARHLRRPTARQAGEDLNAAEGKPAGQQAAMTTSQLTDDTEFQPDSPDT